MTGVPFLRLPFLPQMEILKHMDNADFLFFSLSSMRCGNLVKLANRSIEKVGVQFIEDRSATVMLGDGAQFGLTLTEDKKPVCYVQNNQWMHPLALFEKKHYHMMEHFVIQRMFAVFKKVEKLIVGIQDVENIKSCVLWKYTKSVHQLLVVMKKRKLSARELAFLNQEVTVSSHFSIHDSKGFNYQKGFTHNTVMIETPRWNAMDAIIASESTVIKIECPLPPATELNRILKAWIAGGKMENLRILCIPHGKDAPAGFMDQVMDGITIDFDAGDALRISRVDGKQGLVALEDEEFVFTTDP